MTDKKTTNILYDETLKDIENKINIMSEVRGNNIILEEAESFERMKFIILKDFKERLNETDNTVLNNDTVNRFIVDYYCTNNPIKYEYEATIFLGTNIFLVTSLLRKQDYDIRYFKIKSNIKLVSSLFQQIACEMWLEEFIR